MRRTMFALALLCAACAGAQADDALAGKVKASKEAMKKIGFLAGRWGAVETYPASNYMPKGGTFRASTRTSSLYQGLHLQVQHTSATRPRYDATGVWSYDADRQEYVLSWFDSMGGLDQYRGKLSEDGKQLTLGAQRGETAYTMDYRIHDPHHYTFKMQIKQGDKAQEFLTAEYTRAGQGPRIITYVCPSDGKQKEAPLGAKVPNC